MYRRPFSAKIDIANGCEKCGKKEREIGREREDERERVRERGRKSER